MVLALSWPLGARLVTLLVELEGVTPLEDGVTEELLVGGKEEASALLLEAGALLPQEASAREAKARWMYLFFMGFPF